MKPVPAYDYIITGAGCAGLSLLVRLIRSGAARSHKILLVDREPKKANDRTWCFWEREAGLFEPVVYRRWNQLWFHAPDYARLLHLQPYQYKLIRGIDFYEWCFDQIGKHPNVTFLQGSVDRLFSNAAEGTGAVIDGRPHTGRYVFNSILFEKPALKPRQYWMLQHFKGWVIDTAAPSFDAQTGTLMDFRTDQSEGATFFYVLPFSDRQALVEYTLFSRSLLDDSAYEAALRQYIEDQLHIRKYTVREREFGVIPMSNYPFPPGQGRIINIGTAGGQTKASSGYTFQFIQKQAQAITDRLLQTGRPLPLPRVKKRFHFYDSILLHILHHNTLSGAAIFTDLFKNNRPAPVLKFLDNETSLDEELGIISSLPTLPFLKAAIRQVTPFR